MSLTPFKDATQSLNQSSFMNKTANQFDKSDLNVSAMSHYSDYSYKIPKSASGTRLKTNMASELSRINSK